MAALLLGHWHSCHFLPRPLYNAFMSTMNISLPDEMKAFIDRQVAERGYGTSSEFLRDLIRREQERLHLRNLMLEAMAAPKVGEADAAYFQSYRDRIKKAAAEQKSASKSRKSR
jgi:antitoxin ParD1/3/4